jgi:uncharacterized protein YozE (UPF0346 family)
MIEADVSTQSSTKMLDACSELANDFSDSADFVKLDFEFVDLTQYLTEASNFLVCHLDGIAGSIVLYLSCDLCLVIELRTFD